MPNLISRTFKIENNKRYSINIYLNGAEYWFYKDKIHREDGPAIKYTNGNTFWYKHGKLHREDGPAVINSDGTETYWLNGKLHREDGPAVINSDGTETYWLNGIYYPDINSDDEWIIFNIII